MFDFKCFIGLVLGIYTGLLLMSSIFAIILSIVIKSRIKNKKLHKISQHSLQIYKENRRMKDKVLLSLQNEIIEVSNLYNPKVINPYFNLSINDFIFLLNTIQFKLRSIIHNPLFKDAKNMTINQVLSIGEIVKKPIDWANKKSVKILIKIWSIILFIINIISPIAWIRRILKITVFKEGKKDLLLAGYDYIGSVILQTFDKSARRQKRNEK